jgi:hypothetical protein
VPTTCEAQGMTCAIIGDGCGGMLDCASDCGPHTQCAAVPAGRTAVGAVPAAVVGMIIMAVGRRRRRAGPPWRGTR